MHVAGDWRMKLVCWGTLVLALAVLPFFSSAQTVYVVGENNASMSGAMLRWTCLDGGQVQTYTVGEAGLLWPSSECNKAVVILSAFGYVTDTVTIERPRNAAAEVRLKLEPLLVDLASAEVEEKAEDPLTFMSSLEAGGMYRGIKSAVMLPEAQLAVGGEVQPRNIFAALPGANIWESDAAGLQLGVGVRGMSPNRSAHLSMRQNGHPIAADPLGYPESYYTPPLTMVEEVQWVSGASALQYGSQLGGMLNFVMRPVTLGKGPSGRWTASHTSYAPREGSYRGHHHFFAEASGGGSKLGFLVGVDRKAGSGWRDNSVFESTTATLALHERFEGNRGLLKLDQRLTLLRRTEQQSGGLTDVQFEIDPRRSDRSRNWFDVSWNIASADLIWTPARGDVDVNISTRALQASRKSLGFLGTPNRVDYGTERDLIWGDFASLGWDTRVTKRWTHGEDDRLSALVLGSQGYLGQNRMRQAPGVPGTESDFEFDNSDVAREESDFTFPNAQLTAFAQGIWSFAPSWSLTPGVRWERIGTFAEGTYREVYLDLAGNVVDDSLFASESDNRREIFLPGVGVSWKRPAGEWYANAVRNFRAVNFSDIQINNLGVVVDPEISDERGANVDLGYRTSGEGWTLDVSAFVLWYQDRIGLLVTTVPDPILVEKPVLLRTNLSDAQTAGLECSASRQQIWKNGHATTVLGSASWMRSRYLEGGLAAIVGKEVELVPRSVLRISILHRTPSWDFQVLAQHVGDQFTEATNSKYTPTALHGLIPNYRVLDLGVQRRWQEGKWSIGMKLNNATNTAYFTRRALAYPGPGILPSDGISARLTLRYAPD